MIQLTDKHWAVEVPESWETAELHFQPSIEDMLNDREGFSELIMWYTAKTCGSPRQKLVIKLPTTGSWQFLFTTKEATWEQAESVVKKVDIWFKNYSGCSDYKDPNFSLQSLLASKGCDVRKNYALIQKTNQ